MEELLLCAVPIVFLWLGLSHLLGKTPSSEGVARSAAGLLKWGLGALRREARPQSGAGRIQGPRLTYRDPDEEER